MLRLYEKLRVFLFGVICCLIATQGIFFSKHAFAQASLTPTLPFPTIPSNRSLGVTASACNILAISGATASGSQSGNPPTNAIDANLSTRWSNQGLGSSISVDFGKERSVCSVNVAWYRGNERTNTFTIAISKDGKSYTNVFSGASSGKTTGFESYDFPDTTARYVKITVT